MAGVRLGRTSLDRRVGDEDASLEPSWSAAAAIAAAAVIVRSSAADAMTLRFMDGSVLDFGSDMFPTGR
jgi:hypothetical protein